MSKRSKEFEYEIFEEQVKEESGEEPEELCEVLLKEEQDIDAFGVSEAQSLRGHRVKDAIGSEELQHKTRGTHDAPTEDILDWCHTLPETDEDDDITDTYDTPVDIPSEDPAVLPPDFPEDARRSLEHEDAKADKAIMSLLPIDHLNFHWTTDPTHFKGQRETFTATPGPTFPIHASMTPFDIFQKFFDDDLLELIVTQTNRHSNLSRHDITTENSRLLKWKDTNRDEILIFLAILMLQALAPLHLESDYFQENGYLTLKYFKNLMTYNRFILLKRLIHFTDATSLVGLSSGERKLRKIQPVIDHLNERFSSMYIPKQNVAIDESLLRWRGRSSLAQKIAAKDGMRSYELCESDTGYLWRFFVCRNTNESEGRQELVDCNFASNPTAQIVEVLVKPLLGNGYTLLMDCVHNSPLLARYLKSQKTDCFGTLRADRAYVPDPIKYFTDRVGDTIQSFSEDLSVLLWRDANPVATISTFHQPEVKDKRKRPQIIQDYNLLKGSLCKKDQSISAYPIERSKNLGWHKKVFRRLLNVTIHNAFVIFRSRNAISNRAFRRRLADEIIAACLPRVEGPLVRTKAAIQGPKGRKRPILEGNHFFGRGTVQNARCVWCKKSRTKYVCKQCDVALCLEICFEEYHTRY